MFYCIWTDFFVKEKVVREVLKRGRQYGGNNK